MIRNKFIINSLWCLPFPSAIYTKHILNISMLFYIQRIRPSNRYKFLLPTHHHKPLVQIPVTITL